MLKATSTMTPPIALKAFRDESLCYGFTWEISDETQLARLVARLVVGHHLHVAKILTATASRNAPKTPEETVQATISSLRGLPHAHRDGWLFQMISWIALQISSSERLAVSVPQPRPADKGFDALLVKLSEGDAALSSVLICEDKATNNSRDKVRDQIWKEFEECESGQRDSELMSDVTAILERH